MNSTLPPFLQASSGALGSAVGNAIVYPLDLATTRMQNNARRPHHERLNLRDTLSHLLSHNNYLSEIYSGIGADTLSTLLSNFIYFYTYTSLQKGLHVWHTRHPIIPSQNPHQHGSVSSSPAGIGGLASKASEILPKPSKPTALEELLIGILSGLISKGITLPISTVCVRQQIENDTDTDTDTDEKDKKDMTLLETLSTIYQESGIEGLFSGLKPTIPLTLLPSLTLYIHTVLVRLLLPARHRTHPPAGLTFLLGAVSNALATIPLYPLVLIKVLSQSGRDKGKNKHKLGMLETLVKIIKRGGIRTLYTGLEGQLVKGLVQQGVMMLVKQRVEQGVIKAYKARSHAVTA
ncbi:hypothetical protein V865_001435 [Kwoniella europaea PYCC6329]|uniref:Solute carrier family 25 (Peroxisomal adenine nucleotide transporter), member 17 n=1 Tax=Kwoniella europaea PYCC6329 TaxID=1423913 RepID=A0AAX4KD77_9TREE